jgi:hypothetical protein
VANHSCNLLLIVAIYCLIVAVDCLLIVAVDCLLIVISCNKKNIIVLYVKDLFLNSDKE